MNGGINSKFNDEEEDDVRKSNSPGNNKDVFLILFNKKNMEGARKKLSPSPIVVH